ncbi:hypothetical protein [Burkholderia sp. 8Y]|uniref:hypothetical protein n=1 Tax=Burkholderia sp. 8Y TaxID=2653133 RepID=UPI001356C20E|nr:hypothetical protein [Burkholderia sp. 8Y]
MSLAIHLALAACRRERSGTAYQFNELLRVLYMTLFLQENGFGALPLELYARAEKNLNGCLSREKQDDPWFIDAETASVLEQVLRLHDEQLRGITYRDLTAATERLEAFIRSARISPLPDDVRLAVLEAQANSNDQANGTTSATR